MAASETVLFAIWAALTLLALGLSYFVFDEARALWSEVSGSRRQVVERERGAIARPRDTGPLRQPKPDNIPLERTGTTNPSPAIEPLRDAKVVQQLIEHLEKDEPSTPNSGN